MAAHRGLAAIDGCACLRSCSVLHPHHGRKPRPRQQPRQLHPIALARFFIAFALLLLVLAVRLYLDRFEQLFEDHTIFSGVTYVDAHVALTGTLFVCAALVLGAVFAGVNAMSVLPAVACLSWQFSQPWSAFSRFSWWGGTWAAL